ncbi:signal recognition particle-docking protein FtsY [Cyanobium sp. Alchichica 3B3-8F6]|uniref:signal recognition particle-docking protein FtsY n=1 Tax=Cyanobium sp. Alchichica 3B3-8F6 TaxID=2823696 RepID=UPI0020CE9876|nr:signal recognition particle-docking protein FtsY [Cyanobium sp. Alchichica 3B3-8F6]MCP9881586.1 signal recognition particle-docking protein FtsY [Cyanobium sp. Alchichica 3B3-8F6]
MVYDWFNRTGPDAADGETPPSQASGPSLAPDDPTPAASAAAQPEGSSADPNPDPNAEALEWARQAYARLKAQQEAQKQAQQEPAPNLPAEPQAGSQADPQADLQTDLQAQPPLSSSRPDPVQAVQNPAEGFTAPASAEPSQGLSLLEQAAAQRAERQQAITASAAVAPVEAAPADSAEPSLGDFDTTFTWSAEVLAAQGKRVDQVSLEEIDWLGRLRQGLEQTRQGFVTQLLDTLGDDPLTPEVVDDLETTLLRADVGVQATDQVLDALRKRMNEEVVDPAEGLRFLKEQLQDLLDAPTRASGSPLLAPERDRLNVWLMVGVNGVGKTTTLGKLANLAVRSGYSCLIAAADTFRAAAVQQVQVWGDRSNVPVIANPSANADPAAVVYDAIGAAQAKGTELVLVDTAGRLQTKHNLMEELSKVRRIVDKLAPEAVVESLLVLDASQGQNGLRQAMAFAKAAGLTGVVLTKLDGSARGGVALAVASEAGLPIRFIGAGEGIRDLRPFNSFEFVEALLAR